MRKKSEKMKVFGFCDNPHGMMIITEKGQLVARMGVESRQDAMDKMSSESTDSVISQAIGTGGYMPIWVDDSGGDERVIAACKIMEESNKKERAVGSSTNSGEKEKIETDETVSGETQSAGYVFKTTGKTKSIKVRCQETLSEQRIKELARELRELKNEAEEAALESARQLSNLKASIGKERTDFKERIDAMEQEFFAAIDGESYSYRECEEQVDWEGGARRWIHPDTGEVVKTEEIPDTEKQCALELEPKAEAEPAEDKNSGCGAVEQAAEAV